MLDSFTVGALLALLATPARAQWTLSKGGSSGVSAMQLTVATETNVVVYDKFEQNPLKDKIGNYSLGSVYSVKSNSARSLLLTTNTFCATGTWLSNGTLINTGGNPRYEIDGNGSPNGLQGVRMFTPCADGGDCDVYESPQRIRLTGGRWYPSSARLSDGSSFIFGGAFGGGWTNNVWLNNPSFEFFPPKNMHGKNGLAVPSQFLIDSLPHNMFPHIMLLPNNQLFVAANNMSMSFNWETNTERRLPNLPNGQRVVYPMSGVGVLLPLTPENNYKAEVMLCGGSDISDSVLEGDISSQDPASRQCSRMVMDEAGIAAGWATEQMPEGRVMPDAVILPDGKVLIVNGAKTGTAGYGNVKNQVGLSNADNPAYTPVLYDPTAAPGKRFNSTGMPTSNIARMYHSTATLLPDGRVMIAGSNPNAFVETRTYGTEYQVEYISPPYMAAKIRPAYANLPTTWNYNQPISITLTQMPVSINPPTMTVSLMDLGFATHGVHMDMRMVKLKCTLSTDRKTLTITGPPSATVYPPGPAWVYVLANGIPSEARRVLIGTGASPPVDQGAIDNMLATTPNPGN